MGLYLVRTEGIVDTGTQITEAACKDADDIPVSGSCTGISGDVVSGRHIDWTTQERPAQYRCTYRGNVDNTDYAAEIVCRRFDSKSVK